MHRTGLFFSLSHPGLDDSTTSRVVSGSHPVPLKKIVGVSELIETIYIDVVGDGARRASRYTLLFEKLEAAEAAQTMHAQLAKRIAKRHAEHVAQVRKELEEEGERLRRAIQVTKPHAGK